MRILYFSWNSASSFFLALICFTSCPTTCTMRHQVCSAAVAASRRAQETEGTGVLMLAAPLSNASSSQRKVGVCISTEQLQQAG